MLAASGLSCAIELRWCLVDEGPAADRDEHQVRHDGLAITEVDGQFRSGVLDLGALTAQMQRDAAPAELLGQLVRSVCVLP
jgi:hypothetical protein